MPISSVDNSSHKVLDLGKTPLSLLATLQIEVKQLGTIGLVRCNLDGLLGGDDEDGSAWLTLKGEEALAQAGYPVHIAFEAGDVDQVSPYCADHGAIVPGGRERRGANAPPESWKRQLSAPVRGGTDSWRVSFSEIVRFRTSLGKRGVASGGQWDR